MAEVSYQPPGDMLPGPSMVLKSMEGIESLPDLDARKLVIQTLFKLVDGVLAAPDDMKKRRVRKGNETFHQRVGQYPAAVGFLNFAGFVDSDDPDVEGDAGRNALLQMPVAFVSRLTDAHQALAQAAEKIGLIAPPIPQNSTSFNPYQSSSTATDTTRKVGAPKRWKGETERLRDEIKHKRDELKEQIDQAPEVPLELTVFWASQGRRLEDVIKAAAYDSESVEGDANLLRGQLAAMKSAMAGPHTFASADKRELADLSRSRTYGKCILRVVCPDKSVLQASFRSASLGKEVVSLLTPHLASHVHAANWYLYHTPPLTRLLPSKTLSVLGLAPGATLYLGFDGDKPGPPYLSDALVAQLGPYPASEPTANKPHISGEGMGWGAGHSLGRGSASSTG